MNPLTHRAPPAALIELLILLKHPSGVTAFFRLANAPYGLLAASVKADKSTQPSAAWGKAINPIWVHPKRDRQTTVPKLPIYNPNRDSIKWDTKQGQGGTAMPQPKKTSTRMIHT
ncbi:hypothetical protein N7D90_24480 (plasmid) [Pseudomonas fragi]|uniref:hypothetical protein n=1 Tax=Pseudomonas fragi TaxID=296 RepID=UPI0021C1FA95|nr:hypothetical protein [Pseudomonas fragi]UXL41019.1 hypothetical protein N7D90_24480 [Pseudomonas fragi]